MSAPKRYALTDDQIEQLLPKPSVACFASDRITVEGRSVGYMYRTEDDGWWKFFAGDEDEDYTNEPDNFGLYSLNTIANYDRAIIPFLDAPPSAWLGNGDTFVPDPQGVPAE